jgi:glycolate oxidase iron-sulfur subunit
MQTNLADFIKHTPEGQEAEAILRTCVHCGFCTATCPTYQLLGDELDGPRGRIYLMKQMLEGAPVTAKTQLHLDRCLTCRSCETTCPSGVRYGRLVDISRPLVEAQVQRSFSERMQRRALRAVLPKHSLFKPLFKLGQMARPVLSSDLQRKLPRVASETPWPAPRHARRMLVLDGCVQPTLAPNINPAAARVCDKLGISLFRAQNAGCCGAVSYHLNAHEEGLGYMRRNIDAWWPHVEQGVEAIVMTASGCGLMVKEYAHLLKHDPAYADKAARISDLTKDLAQIIALQKDKLASLIKKMQYPAVAFHSPCTLQHGQQLRGLVEEVLAVSGFHLTPVPNSHLCCGSAGTYSILQPEISKRLLTNKVAALESGSPDQIVTANIGCLTHIQSGTSVSVKHWIETLEQRLAS